MGLKQNSLGLIEPDDAEWKHATPALRRAFDQDAGDLATAPLEKQLTDGIGAYCRMHFPEGSATRREEGLWASADSRQHPITHPALRN